MSVDLRVIQRRRHLCLVIVRAVALLLALVGALAAGMAFQSRIGRFSGFEYLAVPVLAILGAFWVPTLVLAAASRPLSRWLVPVPGPASECPRCGYSLKNLKAPICPECGLTLRSTESAPARTPGQK